MLSLGSSSEIFKKSYYDKYYCIKIEENSGLIIYFKNDNGYSDLLALTCQTNILKLRKLGAKLRFLLA